MQEISPWTQAAYADNQSLACDHCINNYIRVATVSCRRAFNRAASCSLPQEPPLRFLHLIVVWMHSQVSLLHSSGYVHIIPSPHGVYKLRSLSHIQTYTYQDQFIQEPINLPTCFENVEGKPCKHKENIQTPCS